jgi:hypothetical protein
MVSAALWPAELVDFGTLTLYPKQLRDSRNHGCL